MHPEFRIYAKNGEITNAIRDRLISLSVDDHEGWKADRLSIELDDRDAKFSLPNSGDLLFVKIGYTAKENHTVPRDASMTDLGAYTLTEIEVEKEPSGGRTITICGHGWDTAGTLKETRTVTYHETTVGKIFEAICARNGFTLEATVATKSIPIPHEVQTSESDAHFASRFAKAFGCIVQFENSVLRLIAKGTTTRQVVLGEPDLLRYKFLTQGKGRYSGCRAIWWDAKTAKEAKCESKGAGNRVENYLTLPKTYPDESSANRACAAKMRALDGSTSSFRFSVVGRPALAAGAMVTIVGLRPEIPVSWKLTRVEHRFDKSGYITSGVGEIHFVK